MVMESTREGCWKLEMGQPLKCSSKADDSKVDADDKCCQPNDGQVCVRAQCIL